MIDQHPSIGYFVGASAAPAYDPPLDAECPVCGKPQSSPRVTISIAPQAWLGFPAGQSFYFRAHKACWENLGHDEQALIESSIIDKAVSASRRSI